MPLAAIPEPDDDAQRMLAFAGGDAGAFDQLFERWSARLLRFLERMVKDRALAEELVQETFLRVHRARDGYSPEARFSTWLYRIATNLALNELRRPRHRDPHVSTDDDATPTLAGGEVSPDRVVDARRQGESLVEALAELPERQRAALVLAAVEGLPYADVASALEISESAVKALVHRGRSALAAKLGGSGE